MWLAPLLIIISIILRFIAWNEYIIPHLNSDKFWLEWYMKIYYPTYTRLDSLAIGVLIGYLHHHSATFKRFIHSNGNILFFSGAILLGLSLLFCSDQASMHASIFGFTAVAISFGIILLSAISESSFLYRSHSWITVQLASLSYAVYLSHKGIIHIIQNLAESSIIPTSGILMLSICLAGCILTGILYRYVIERPASRIKNKILGK